MKLLKSILTTAIALLSLNVSALPITATTGSDFTVDFDSIGGTPVAAVDGLSASARFYDFAFGYDQLLNKTTLTFDFDLTNTSTLPILTSRVTTLGFLTTPNVILGDSSVSGIFDTVDSGNVPNQGVVEFCFSGVNCAGGGNGGVALGSTATGFATLAFLGDFSSINFDDFTVRYQSVTCLNEYTVNGGNCPGSASGGPVTNVPEPGIVALIAVGLLGMSAVRRKKTS